MSRSGSFSDWPKNDARSSEAPRSLDWADRVSFEPKAAPPFGARPRLTRAPSGRKRIAVAACALIAALAAGAGIVGATGSSGDRKDAAASVVDHEKRLAELEAETKRRSESLAELERRSAAKESELADNTIRVAQLEQRKQALEREIAELIAPVSDPAGERDIPRAEQDAALAPNDPSPPDEEPALDAPTGAVVNTERRERTIAAGDVPKSQARIDETESGAQSQQTEAVVAASQDIGGATRVFIHVRSADPAARERAQAVAAELRRRGVTVAEIRGVRYPVRQDSVRFFYDADRAAISALQDAVRQASAPGGAAPKALDYRDFRAPPRQGTLELWLS